MATDRLGRDGRVADGAADSAHPTAKDFSLVAAGAYHTTDTPAELLGRAPRAYADWLAENAPPA